MLVLRRKGTLELSCSAKTLDELNEKINQCYWAVKGCMPKGSVYELSDYLANKVISELTIVDLPVQEVQDDV